MRTSKSSVSNKLTVECLARESGRSWRFTKQRLQDCGLYPPADHPRRRLLAALRQPAPTQAAASLRERKTFEEWRKLKIRNDREEAGLISREAVKATVKALVPKFHELLDRKLLNEYPAAVAGLDVPGARIYGKKLNDEIRAEIQSWAHLWPS